jgi:phosphoadenosine phosphosulfate reductase
MIKFDVQKIAELNQRFEKDPTERILGWAWKEFGSRAVIGTSFQGAGLVMIDIARKNGFPLPVFTIDTGLLFPETIELKKQLEDFFQIKIEALDPPLTVKQQVEKHGPELWRSRPDDCCWMRKVLPLQKKLETLDVWITGLRREQSKERRQIEILELYEFDPVMNRDVLKLNPMARWKRDAVWNYLKEHGIPYNPLHDRGYRSIGCVPCTRPVVESEDDRAGRWTGFKKTECGIHTFMKKKKAG